MDLSKDRVIDSHCHPFLPERETKRFEQYWSLSRYSWSLSGSQIDPKHLKNMINYKLMLKELGRFLLGNSDETEGKIVATRKKLYSEDPAGYIKMLFKDAGIETVLLDTGVPNIENYGYTIPVEVFGKLIPSNIKKRCIVRIEPIIYGLFQKEDLVFDEFVTTFEQELEENIKAQQAVALKTTIAYNTGIEIEKVTRREASRAYAAYRKNKDDERRVEKQIRDYLVLISLEKCIKHDIPMQVHTGVGDAPVHDLRGANPLLLFKIIGDEHFQQVKIVLVHGGYPYLAESGSLVNMYPNVWLDLSTVIPFASLGVARCLTELFEMAPITKIMYGSDCWNIPEISWFSAVYFKKSLGKILKELVHEDVISTDYAKFVATRILSENARELYKLGN